MSKKLYVKKETGSISLFAVLSMLFFLVFILGISALSMARNRIQIESLTEIKSIYKKDSDIVYNSRVAATNEIIPIYTKEQLDAVGSGESFEIDGKIYKFEDTPTTRYIIKAPIWVKSDYVLPDSVDANNNLGSWSETYAYTGTYQEIIIPESGEYKLEVWGASGGDHNTSYKGGRGGYAVGNVVLEEGTTLFVYVGGVGKGGTDSGGYAGGFNGGGSTTGSGNGGGGATDIRIGTNSLYARVIVAGGGGGASNGSTTLAGYGGGNIGGNTSRRGTASGGSQSAAGITTPNSSSYNSWSAAEFGIGGNITGGTVTGGGGGGGGWYGGAAGPNDYPSYNDNDDTAGAGGSGWVFTEANVGYTSSSYTGGIWMLGSQYYLKDAQTIAGNSEMPHPDGGKMTGNEGNGFARITKKYVNSGLILHYDGINNTGNGHSNSATVWKDLSGNGYDGQLKNFNNTSTSGWTGDALVFDGVDDFVEIDTRLNLSEYSDVTVCAVYTVKSLSTGQPAVFSANHTGTGRIFFGYSTAPTYSINFTVPDTWMAASTGTLVLNKKSSVIATYKGKNNNKNNAIYKNGQLILSNSTGMTSSWSGTLNLGRGFNGHPNHPCANIILNSILVYNRALSESEIQQNYQMDRSVYNVNL